MHPGEGWRHLLPWLSRIRRRVTAIHNGAKLRAGDNPQTKAIERHQLMRAMLGLLDLKEPKLRLAIERAQVNWKPGLPGWTAGE